MRLHDHLSIFCDFRPCVAGCFSGIANAFLCVFRILGPWGGAKTKMKTKNKPSIHELTVSIFLCLDFPDFPWFCFYTFFFVFLLFLIIFLTKMVRFCFEVFAKTKKFTNILFWILMFDANRSSFTVYFLFSFLFLHLPKGLTRALF